MWVIGYNKKSSLFSISQKISEHFINKNTYINYYIEIGIIMVVLQARKIVIVL